MVESSRTRYWRRYVSYLIVAALVGIITVAIREVIGLILLEDTPFTYAVSVLFAYGCGIVLSFVWQARFTFRHRQARRRRGHFWIFAGVAVAGSILTVTLSRQLRYEAGFDQLFGAGGPGLAFAAAAMLTSVVSYAANARYVFVPDERKVTARE